MKAKEGREGNGNGNGNGSAREACMESKKGRGKKAGGREREET